MALSRRQFIQRSGIALGAVVPGARAIHRPHELVSCPRSSPVTPALRVTPASMRLLALRAVDAAKRAGATYADVRLTREIRQRIETSPSDTVGAEVLDDESLAVGVRALVNGAWGFAASTVWVPDEMDTLARESVQQARYNAVSQDTRTELAPNVPVTGEWIMPGIDPFTISIEEKTDFLHSWRQAALETHDDYAVPVLQASVMRFVRQERFLASTEGTAIFQTVYTTEGRFPLGIVPDNWRARSNADGIVLRARGLEARGGGWETFLDARIVDQLPKLFAQGNELLKTPRVLGRLGRFDVVCDAETMANVVSRTFGPATQLDRILGYEANAGGTSYIGHDPLEQLGTFAAAAPLVTLTANRSLRCGLATVQWDDEGVAPREITLVKDGVLTDLQTTREQAPWIAPWYSSKGTPVQSAGYASAPSALSVTMQHTPNLSLAPTASNLSFDDLVRDTVTGIAVIGGGVSTDYQARTGNIAGTLREIVNGKLGDVLHPGARLMFESTEFWKNVIAMGGPNTVEHFPGMSRKGEPTQVIGYTISAVPAKIKNVAVVRA